MEQIVMILMLRHIHRLQKFAMKSTMTAIALLMMAWMGSTMKIMMGMALAQ